MEFSSHTLADAIDDGRGLRDRGYTFVSSDGEETYLSFDQLRTEAARRATFLRRLGLKKGDRLAMVVPDGLDFVPTFLGAVYGGFVPVPLYPPLSLGRLDAYLEALVAILKKAEPTYLCTTERVQQILWSIVPKVPSLKGIVTTAQLGAAPGEQLDGPAQVTPADTAFLQFTSGSTATPKGVVVSHANLRANAWAIMRDGVGARPDDVCVSWLPLYHDMGLIGFVIAPMFVKIAAVFLPTMSFIKNANLWMETMHKKKGTLTFAPNFAYALAAKRARKESLEKWDLSRVRVLGCGAEPIHAETALKFLETYRSTGLRPQAFLPAYGMAEATLAVSFVGMEETLKTDAVDAAAYEAQRTAQPARNGRAVAFVSCGRPFPHHEIAVMDDDGKMLPERRVGELCLRGPSVAQGYFRDPEATARAFSGGWLKTGDLGYLADGEVYITGRKKDLIIVNGRNYDPQRIEWLVEDVPGIRKGSTVAFSRPGSASEELVIVVEVRERDTQTLADAVRLKVNEQLQLTVADLVLLPPGTLPKTSSGKLQRQKTRTQYLEGRLGKEGLRTMGAASQRLSLAKHLTLAWVGRGRHVARGLLRRAIGI